MSKIRNIGLRKSLFCFTMLICIVLMVFLTSVKAEAADERIALTIYSNWGDGIKEEKTITMDELRELEQLEWKKHTYSGYNHWPSLQVFEDAEGPTLESILEYAGVREKATLVKFSPANGAYYTYTVKELLLDERYYFPDGETGDLTKWPPARTEEGKVQIETIIGVTSKDNDVLGKLLYGQRSPLEPTACKSEQMEGILPGGRILVTNETPEKWDAPDAYPGSGTVVPGTEVKLQHGDGTPYGALVYYTLDGSEPTVKSNIANISYPYFQPFLNAPIPINKNITIKARTIGIGKSDSDVATYEYTIGKQALVIEGAELKTPVYYVLENLKAMSSSVENYKAFEDDKAVDLAGKGVLLGTVLDKLSASDRWRVKFVDTAGKEYDGGTVQDIKNQKCMLAYEVNGSEINDVSDEQTVYIQILRNYDNNSYIGNRLKNIKTVKLINVDDEITISGVKLYNNLNNEVTSVSPGGGYRIEARLTNNKKEAKDALLIFRIRSGVGATAFEGGKTIGYAAVKAVVSADGSRATAEFTMPANITGTAYTDILVWDNYINCRSLGKENHDLSFNIK